MRILITGGAGFIGSRLALKLVEVGHEVTVLDNLSPQIHGQDPEVDSPLLSSIKGCVRFVKGSVCDPEVLAGCIEGQEGIVHLAAETGTGQSMYEIKRYADVNVGGTALMLDLLANQPHVTRRIVVASSRAIYGEGKYRAESGEILHPGPRREQDMRAGRFEPLSPVTGEDLSPVATDEGSAIHPTSVYGITKQNQEQLVMTVGPAVGIEAVALRYQNVYGPGQSLKNPYTGILSIFSTRISNGRHIDIYEDGRESRDFVYIDDVVDATCAALLKPEASNQVIGVGSGVATDVMTVARSLVLCLGREVPLRVTGAFRVGDVRHNFADLSKAANVLGFFPKVPFESGIQLFASWVKEQAPSEDTYDRSISELRQKGLFRE